ncbi:MAG: hypothetical protein ABI585_11660 [Betaproteobacteria bacterium]
MLLAAAGAATSWLVRYWLDVNDRKRVRAKREVKQQLKTWEEEGGSLAPGLERREAPETHAR